MWMCDITEVLLTVFTGCYSFIHGPRSLAGWYPCDPGSLHESCGHVVFVQLLEGSPPWMFIHIHRVMLTIYAKQASLFIYLFVCLFCLAEKADVNIADVSVCVCAELRGLFEWMSCEDRARRTCVTVGGNGARNMYGTCPWMSETKMNNSWLVIFRFHFARPSHDDPPEWYLATGVRWLATCSGPFALCVSSSSSNTPAWAVWIILSRYFCCLILLCFHLWTLHLRSPDFLFSAAVLTCDGEQVQLLH